MGKIKVKKSSGRLEEFSEIKLLQSLIASGANDKLARSIVTQLRNKLTQKISTRKIYSLAFRLLKKSSKKSAVKYSLKKSILALGPDGYHFEKLICALFENSGYKSQTGIFKHGQFVRHEIDVVAKKPSKTIFVECKFHNSAARVDDLKVALYVKARWDDVKENKENKVDEFWLVTNTKFSEDAIKYSQGVGLKLLSSGYPEKNNLHDWIIQSNLHPITCITKLKKHQISDLLKRKIILCHEIIKNPAILLKIGLNELEMKAVLNEIKVFKGNNH